MQNAASPARSASRLASVGPEHIASSEQPPRPRRRSSLGRLSYTQISPTTESPAAPSRTPPVPPLPRPPSDPSNSWPSPHSTPPPPRLPQPPVPTLPDNYLLPSSVYVSPRRSRKSTSTFDQSSSRVSSAAGDAPNIARVYTDPVERPFVLPRESRLPPSNYASSVSDVRQSSRSIWTATSSAVDLSNTERSSVVTSNTSESDHVRLQKDWAGNNEEIDIDDVFSLYAEGFDDAAAEPPVEPQYKDSEQSLDKSIYPPDAEIMPEDQSSYQSTQMPSHHSDDVFDGTSREPSNSLSNQEQGHRSEDQLLKTHDILFGKHSSGGSYSDHLPEHPFNHSASHRHQHSKTSSPSSAQEDASVSIDPARYHQQPSLEHVNRGVNSLPMDGRQPIHSSPLNFLRDSDMIIPQARPQTAHAAQSRPQLRSDYPISPTAAHFRTSTQIMTADFLLQSHGSETSSPAPAEARDRYGFKCASQYVTQAQYDAWNLTYTEHLHRRRAKWEDMMRRFNLTTRHPTQFPPRSEKMKKYVRKGIPPGWRGAAWFWYADGPARLAKRRGLYDRLVQRAEAGEISANDKDHIERDLHRTFPDNDKFRPDASASRSSTSAPELPMIQSLRRVLQAFALHKPKIGYCQSLNFLAGLLLICLEADEEKAFIMLDMITTQILPGTHGIALEGANVDISVLMNELRENMPALWSRVDDRRALAGQTPGKRRAAVGDMRDAASLPTISLATTSWFMSCFASTLPVETTLRVWDCLFYEGSKTLFRVALAIFKAHEAQLLRLRDPMEIFQLVQTLPRRMLDVNTLMDICYRRRFGEGLLGQDTVDARRAERRQLYAKDRDSTGEGATEDADADERPDRNQRRSRTMSLSRSRTRSRIKRALTTKRPAMPT